MSVSATGAGQNLAVEMLMDVIAGGATVHLIGGGETMAYTDGATELTAKSDASVSVAELDWTITPPAGFNGVATLANDAELDFGSPNIGVVSEIVIQNNTNGDLWLVADEPTDPNLTGEAVTIAAGTQMYEFGNPT